VDDRVDGRLESRQSEPPPSGHRVDLTLRYLGIILPIALTYVVGFGLGLGSGGQAAFAASVTAAAAVWAGASVALGLRRDWAGVGAVTFFYVLIDAWIWLLVTGVMHFD